MDTQHHDDRDLRLPTLRDLIAPLFRYWRISALVGATVFVAVTALVLLTPKTYESEVKFLVKHERADTIVSADPRATAPLRTDVTEDELNSEVELLKSRDLLQRVATASGLIARAAARSNARGESPEVARAAVVRTFEANLRIAPIKDTTFIRVAYRSPDPQLAAHVLRTLSTLYIEKHRELHRPAGAYEFFTTQAQRYQKELADAQARLNEFDQREHVVAPDVEQQGTLQRMSEFESALQQARAKISESDQTIADLQKQLEATPDRQTSQIRTSRNTELTRDLKSRVLTLESQRADMLAKFKPNYPPLRELERQLEQARSALAASEQAPLTEQTTDRDPTYTFLREELARVKSERAAAVARASALERSVASLRDDARRLEETSGAEENLKNAVKSAQQNYELYKQKQEEARIADALDSTRIANVAVAEAPTVPPLPTNTGRSWLILLGGILAVTLGASTAYLLAFVSPFFQRPEEIERTLRVPVLATFAAGRADAMAGATSEVLARLRPAPAVARSLLAGTYSELTGGAADAVVSFAAPATPAIPPDAELALLVQRIFRPRDTKQPVRAVVFAAFGGCDSASELCARTARELATHSTQSVCVVDANFRSPSLHRQFGVPEARGLSDALLGDAASPIVDLATRVGEATWLVPAGFGGAAALPYVAGEALHDHLLQLRAAFEYVLVESPPADEHAHFVAVARGADGVVLVLDAHGTRREAARRVTEQLQAAHVPVLGAVLTNRTYPIPEFLYRRL